MSIPSRKLLLKTRYLISTQCSRVHSGIFKNNWAVVVQLPVPHCPSTPSRHLPSLRPRAFCHPQYLSVLRAASLAFRAHWRQDVSLLRRPDSRPHVMSEIICYTTLQSRALLGSYLVFKLIAKRFNGFNWNKAVKIKCHLWVSGHLVSLCLNLELNIDTSHSSLLLLSRIQQLAPRKLLVPMNLWMAQAMVPDSSSLIGMKITRD